MVSLRSGSLLMEDVGNDNIIIFALCLTLYQPACIYEQNDKFKNNNPYN